MKDSVLDAIIVGAGQAGLSASYYLKNYGLNHLVFERGKIGESWRSQRWDSFVLNSPNRLNELPGNYKGNNPDGFCSAKEFVSSLQEYAETFQLPVVENAKVISIGKNEESNLFQITVLKDNNIKHYYSKQVIIASGEMNEKKVPVFAGNISSRIKQLHTSEYRSAKQLPEGAVLVVGGATSGCQIAEDLADAGRKVYLSTSMVARVPRRYRGKDIMDWLLELKFFDVRKEDITDPVMLNMKAPQMKGSSDGIETLSLQALAKKGVTLIGKLANAEEKNLFFQPNAVMHVKFADQFSSNVKNMIDEFIAKSGLSAIEREFDEADVADINADCAAQITSINLEENKINSIIWTTGFNGDFSYIKLPVFNNEGNPKHQNGISDAEGLYFLGFNWLRCRKSALIHGIKYDAKFITDEVYNYSREQISTPLPQVL